LSPVNGRLPNKVLTNGFTIFCNDSQRTKLDNSNIASSLDLFSGELLIYDVTWLV